MHILYLVSRYPSLSETFIAREMRQLIALKHQITVAQLRWSHLWMRERGLEIGHAQILKPQYGLFPWMQGYLWAAKTKPIAFKNIRQEFYHTWSESSPKTRGKLLTVLLTTLRLAQCLDGSGIEHIRNRFLFGGAISAMWLSQLLDVPYSLTVPMDHITFPMSITRKVVHRASFCVVPTHEMFEMISMLRGSSTDIYLIKTGLELREFEVTPVNEHKSSHPLLLAVGRLVKQKGFDILIKACGLLHDWDVPFDCEIVGNGKEHGRLKQLIRELGLERRISLSGSLPFENVKNRFREATVMVMPSRRASDGIDGLPNVITEALAMRVPVVATAVAAIPELIIDNQTGLLVPPDNPEQLALSIRRLLEDKDLQIRLASAGNEKVRKEFDITQTVQQLEALIHANLRSNRMQGTLPDLQTRRYEDFV